MQYYLEITRRCNLRCKMCPYHLWLTSTPASEQYAGELGTDEWFHVIDQISRFSVITFTGGEPWVRKDFRELLLYAAKHHRIHFISNGTLLDESRAEFCAQLAPMKMGGLGLFFVGISLDGPREVHDAIRGLPGTFDKTVNNVRYLTGLRASMGKQCPLVHVTTVIQEQNYNLLPMMPEIVKSMGADILNLTLEFRFYDLIAAGERNIPEDADVKLPVIPPEPLREALALTREAAKRAGVELRMPNMSDEEIIAYYTGRISLEHYKCQMAWTSLNISPTGNVSTCFWPIFGNVRETSLIGIRNNKIARAFRRQCRSGLSPLCQGCCELACK